MANNKDQEPKDGSKYIIAVLWSGVGDDIGYVKGDVIDFFEPGTEIGLAVWDDPKFHVIYIKDKELTDIALMVEREKDAITKKVLSRRKYSYNLDDPKVLDKVVWDSKDADDTLKVKDSEVAQPDEIVIP